MGFKTFIDEQSEDLQEAGFNLKKLKKISESISKLNTEFHSMLKSIPKEHKKYADKIDSDLYDVDQSMDDLYYRIEDD